MMVGPPMAQVVHYARPGTVCAAELERELARAKRERGEYRDSDAGPECHSKGGGDTCPEQALSEGKDKNEDRARARPNSDREHDRHHFAPVERAGKLAHIDHVIAGLSDRGGDDGHDAHAAHEPRGYHDGRDGRGDDNDDR